MKASIGSRPASQPTRCGYSAAARYSFVSSSIAFARRVEQVVPTIVGVVQHAAEHDVVDDPPHRQRVEPLLVRDLMSRCGELLAREPRLAAIYSDRASALAGYGLITLYTTAMIWVGMWLGVPRRPPRAHDFR